MSTTVASASSSFDLLLLKFQHVIHGEWNSLSIYDVILLIIIGIIAFEILDFITSKIGGLFRLRSIPVRGKHLDEFILMDHLCIGFTKFNTMPFIITYIYVVMSTPNIHYALTGITIINTLLPLFLSFITFDFTYVLFHRTLHVVPTLYKYIHKHHHKQMAPSRSNIDAGNVHPIEMIVGEYNHVLALYIVTTYVMPAIASFVSMISSFIQQQQQLPIQTLQQVHVIATILFVAIGGILAGMNHTRYELVINVFGICKLYDSKDHDIHHRYPTYNYGQYTMLWDQIFGTYRPYDPQDRINPSSQLNPKTGKSYDYHLQQQQKTKKIR